MLLTIVKHPHPALTRPTQPVEHIDDELKQYVREMFDLMYANKGVGLAANQVDLPYRMFIMNTSGVREDLFEGVYINPTILEHKGIQEADEGCLSFPGIVCKVRRAKEIKVRAYDIDGNLVQATISDLVAQVWQHEVDHLDGITFIKRMGPLARRNISQALKELER